MSTSTTASQHQLETSLARKARTRLSQLLFGPAKFPEACNLALHPPQNDIQVCLCGLDSPRDVTRDHLLVAPRPLTIGAALDDPTASSIRPSARLTLKFQEACAEKRLLGEVDVRATENVKCGEQQLWLFEVRGATNWCQPRNIIWRRYLHFVYLEWRKQTQQMRAKELHALAVFYICPRPIYLVSVVDTDAGNIIPMDLVGTIGKDHFSLSLHNTSGALPLIEHARRVALSSVPATQVRAAYSLGKNHRAPSIDWTTLPFQTMTSSAFRLPVPAFALRVRELHVETIRRFETHSFIVCKLVSDERHCEDKQLFVGHVLYEQWRQRALPPQDPTM